MNMSSIHSRVCQLSPRARNSPARGSIRSPNGLPPLALRHPLPEREPAHVARLHVDFKRQCAEDRPVDVLGHRHEIALRAEQWLEAFDEPRREFLVAAHLREAQRADPRAHLGVVNDAVRRHQHVRTREEILRHTKSDFLRRRASRPVVEVAGRT